MFSSFMVVDDLDIVGIALTKLEANSPARVHGHRPLVFAITSELVEADAPQRTKVLQRRCRIEREQQIGRGFEIEASELVWPLAFPHFASGGIPPRPDHGNNVLWNSVNIKKARQRPPRTRALIAIEADFCNDRVWSFEIRLGGERHARSARLAAWCR